MSQSDPNRKPEIPWAFIDCSTDQLVILISHMLNLLIEHNDQVVLTPDALTRFHSRAAPGISVIEYLRRIVKYTNMEKIPLLSLLAYIDLTCAHLPTFTLSTLTVHRFLIAGVCAGSKAQCDVFCTNSHYAKVGGIKVGELNALEREFLRVTQWNLCCNADLLQRYYTSLIRSHGGFTQASAPAVPPFRDFPRSVSKPPAAGEENEEPMEGEEPDEDRTHFEAEDEDMTGNGYQSDGDTTGASPGPSRAEEEMVRRRRKSVDEVLGVAVVVEGGRLSRGRRRKESHSQSNDMEVEESTNINTPHTNPGFPLESAIGSTSTSGSSTETANFEVSNQSPTSPASSSIPSSSRSSIRGTPGRAGRPPSMSNLAGGGRPAEAVVDRRHAGTEITHTPDVLGGTVMGVSIPGSGDGERAWRSRGESGLQNGRQESNMEMYEEEGGSGSRSASVDTQGRGGHDGGGSSQHGAGHGRLLKNLVGVFKKRSSLPPHPHPETTTSRPHSTIPSQPFSTGPTTRDDSNKVFASARQNEPDSLPTPSSPRDPTQSRPGLPTSVTPKIRTRDERSVESLRDRGGLGVGVGSE